MINPSVAADTKVDLYNTIPSNGAAAILMGNTVRGDMYPRYYLYNSSSSATDNFPLVIKPTLQTGNGRWVWINIQQILSDWNETDSNLMSFIQNKPNLATVATSGNYIDLTGNPTIPAAQVNSDWNSISGVSQILNKPDLSIYYLNSNPSNFISGITSLMITTALGYTPTQKRIDTYLGTTDASGNYIVTYGTSFSTTPDVQPQLQAGTVNQMVRITASTTTGFTVNATQRAVLSILGLDVLAGTATNIVGASVGVLVTSR